MKNTTLRLIRAAAAACIVATAIVPVLAQGRGGRGAGAPAAAVDPRDLSGYWELPPDGHDGRNIPRASLAAGVTQQKLAQIAAHDAKAYRWCANGLPVML